MTLILGPLPCIGCGRRVSWWRKGGLLRLMETRQRPHRCPAWEKAA